jgi:hypothetical protein
LQAPSEPIDGPGHHVELATGNAVEQSVELGAILSTLRSTDTVVDELRSYVPSLLNALNQAVQRRREP